MPKDHPTAAELSQGHIRFFSIDTDLIRAAGYKFDSGELGKLPVQLPRAMRLLLTDIVIREIEAHRMEPVRSACETVKRGLADIERIAGVKLDVVLNRLEKTSPIDKAKEKFQGEVVGYVKRCRGEILAVDIPGMAGKLFDRYFSGEPPFEVKKEKKSEFPDAASLLALEEYARANQCRGIVASGDGGVEAFCQNSDWLYCVKKLDALTSLFSATEEESDKILKPVASLLSDVKSKISKDLYEAVDEYLGECSWDVEVVSGSVYRVEGDVRSFGLKDLVIDFNALEAWNWEDDPNKWVVELYMELVVDFGLKANFYARDPIDRDELLIASEQKNVSRSVPAKAYISFPNASLDIVPARWRYELDVPAEHHRIDGGNVEPSYR